MKAENDPQILLGIREFLKALNNSKYPQAFKENVINTALSSAEFTLGHLDGSLQIKIYTICREALPVSRKVWWKHCLH